MMKNIVNTYRTSCRRATLFAHRHATSLMVIFGGALLIGGMTDLSTAQGGPTGSFSEAAYDDLLVKNSVGNLFKLLEGAFGAIIMVVAGLGTLFAAAMGQYRTAVGLLVVAVGAFILRALVSLFFGSDYADWERGGGA